VADDGRRDVFVLDREGNNEAAVSRIDTNTATRIPMYCHDTNEMLQVARNPTLTGSVREVAITTINQLRALADSQNALRKELGLQKVPLPDYMRAL
jgi:Mg2+/Co2+ transporter CorB